MHGNRKTVIILFIKYSSCIVIMVRVQLHDILHHLVISFLSNYTYIIVLFKFFYYNDHVPFVLSISMPNKSVTWSTIIHSMQNVFYLSFF